MYRSNLNKSHSFLDRVVCYYGRSLTENIPPRLLNASDIDTNLCTHVIWSSVILKRDGDLSMFKINITNASSIVREFNNQKPNDVKSLLSWGGWNENLPMYQRSVARFPYLILAELT